MRLRTRFVAALLALALVLSVVSLVGFSLYRDAVVDSERQDLERTSQSLAAQFDAVLTERRRTAELWSRDAALSAHGTTRQRASLRSFVTATKFSGASVITADGTMTAMNSEQLSTRDEQDLVGRQFGDRTYFQRAMAGQTYVSDPVDAESGTLIVTVSTPIYNGTGVAGTFNAAFHVREGDLFDAVRARYAPDERIEVIADGRTIYAKGPNATGSTVGSVNATVASTGWTVTVARTDAVIRPQLRTITLLQTGAFGLVFLSFLGFGGWLYREFVRNFERLGDGIGTLVAGEYGATVDLSGSTEWREIRDQFNELSETLAQRRVEVTVLNRVLRHNLRNAMTVVVGNAERIEAGTDDDRIAHEAATIRRRGESLIDLAEHARAVEATLQPDHPETRPRRIGDVLDEVVETLSIEYPDATVSVVDSDGDAWVPEGDLLTVVLDELARNALAHADGSDPSVSFEVTADDETVSIAVADDGPGLPPVERRLLTQSFEETPTEHSSGLGLWLVKWLVRWADGEIDVTVDDGTVVTVTVPRGSSAGESDD